MSWRGRIGSGLDCIDGRRCDRQQGAHRVGSLREKQGESLVRLHEEKNLLVGLLVACALFGLAKHVARFLALLADLRKFAFQDGILKFERKHVEAVCWFRM